jgi:hypothetical protein
MIHDSGSMIKGRNGMAKFHRNASEEVFALPFVVLGGVKVRF